GAAAALRQLHRGSQIARCGAQRQPRQAEDYRWVPGAERGLAVRRVRCRAASDPGAHVPFAERERETGEAAELLDPIEGVRTATRGRRLSTTRIRCPSR